MQRPALRKGVCEIEEIFDDAPDAAGAQPSAPQPAEDATSQGAPARQPGTAAGPSSLQPPTGDLSGDEDEFHDATEAVHGAYPSASGSAQAADLSDLSDEEHDANAFQDAEESAPGSEVPASEGDLLRQPDHAPGGGSPALPGSRPQNVPEGADAAPGAAAASALLATSSSVSAPEPAPATTHDAAASFGHLPNPEPARRVREPLAGSRPYPPHPASTPGDGGEAAAPAAVPPLDQQAGPRAYQEEGGEAPMGSLPVAGSAEPREYSAEELQASVEKAEELKKAGNALYAAGEMEAAAAKYGEALDAALEGAPQRAVYYANRAACQLKVKEWGPAAADCTRALEIDPGYLKALARRCAAYQELDDLDRALADAQKVLELDPADAAMRKTVKRLEPIVEERREKMKEEMMGKLKDLGNTVLGKFGLSLDNFKAEKDPATGSYSIQFNQS